MNNAELTERVRASVQDVLVKRTTNQAGQTAWHGTGSVHGVPIDIMVVDDSRRDTERLLLRFLQSVDEAATKQEPNGRAIAVPAQPPAQVQKTPAAQAHLRTAVGSPGDVIVPAPAPAPESPKEPVGAKGSTSDRHAGTMGHGKSGSHKAAAARR